MSLNWNWDEKFAVATYTINIGGKPTEYTVNWYEGNAWMIEIFEGSDDTYTVRSFWCDEEHMMRCLGLRKGYNMVTGYEALTKLRIDKTKTHHFKKLVAALAQAHDNLTIEICTEL